MLNKYLLILISVLLSNLPYAQNIIPTKSIVTPPKASSLGSATLALPIDLPDDITSFKPNLSLYYNSDGSSSWVGYGFSIGASSLVVDNRWGIPLFDPNKETELYSLDGMQLMYPDNYLPHRHSGNVAEEFDTSYQLRSKYSTNVGGMIIKTFQPRRKVNFSKIERFGNTPKTYYWKVTNTNGTIQWFGGHEKYQPTNTSNDKYILRANNNNIVEWVLAKTVDRHGNYIKYHYNKGFYNNEETNLKDGKFLYLSEIHYTGLQSNNGDVIREPKTKIVFDNGSNSSSIRTDIIIDAKSGAKKVDARKLHTIKVYQKEKSNFKEVKSFHFEYTNGGFKKTLLSKVIEKNKSDEIVFEHKFDYHSPCYPCTSIYSPDQYQIIDREDFKDVNVSVPLDLDNITGNRVLSRSKSADWGWEIRGGAGLEIRPLILSSTGSSSSTFTAGATYGQSYSNNIELMGFIDINGDGLKDIVFKDNDGIKFKPRINRLGENMFGDALPINTIQNIGVSKGRNTTLFPNSLDFRSKWKSFGRKRFKNETSNSVYITDANADMLMDIVDVDSEGNSIVYFNHLVDGIPTFNPDSSLTPNMLITASPAAEFNTNESPNDEPQNDEPANIINHDAVTMWTSFISKDGYATNSPYIPIISDSLTFYPSSNHSKLRYSIEFYDKSTGNISEIFNYLFDKTNLKTRVYIPHNFDHGDKVFFRIHKNKEGINDVLKTNPTIFYGGGHSNTPSITQANFSKAKAPEGTSYAKDLLLSSQKGFSITESSTININWEKINIPNSSQPGNITFLINKININKSGEIDSIDSLFTHSTYQDGINVIPTNDLSSIPINLNKGEKAIILFEVKSNKFIAMKGNTNDGMPTWKPKLKYKDTGITHYPLVYYNNFSPIKLITPNENQIFEEFSFTNYYEFAGNPANAKNAVKFDVLATANNIGADLSSLKGKIRIVSGNDERQIVFNEGEISMLDMNNEIDLSPIVVGRPSDIALYADDPANTNLLINVQEKLCFLPRYRTNGSSLWRIGTVNSCYPRAFNAFGKQINHLGSNQMGWGQFFYNDIYDNNSPLVNGEYKLINVNILNKPYLGEVNSYGINESNYNNNSTVNDVENDIKNSLNLLDEENEENIEAYFNGQGQNTNFEHPFLPATPIRYITKINNIQKETPRWQGLFDSQFFEPNFARTGGFSESSFNQSFSQFSSQDENPTKYEKSNVKTGMYGVIKKTVSRTKSVKTGLFSVSRSSSNSVYNRLITDFLDINGDGYPDRIFGNKVQYTNMTGGHSDLVTDNNLSEYISNSASSISGTTINLSTSYHNMINSFKKTITDVSNFVKGATTNSWSDFNSSIISNNIPKGKTAAIAISGSSNLTLNDSGSNSRTTNFMQDINGDGLPDRIKENNNGSVIFSLRKGFINNSDSFAGIKIPKSSPGLLSFGAGAGIPIDSWTSASEANEVVMKAFSKIDLSQGIGFPPGSEAPSSVGFNINAQIGFGGSGNNVVSSYYDLNGDGLQDIIINGNSENESVKFNLGNKFDSPTIIGGLGGRVVNVNLKGAYRTISGNAGLDADLYCGIPIFTLWVPIFFVPVPIFTLYFKAGISGALYGSMSMNDTRKGFMDFDGDGHLDYLTKDGDKIKIYLSQIKETNKLRSVSNSLGKQFEIDYTLIGNTYDMPMGKRVMSDVYHFSGKSNTTCSEVNYQPVHDKIEYQGGYYDRRERQFYGYEKIATKRTYGNNTLWTSINTFHNKSYYLRGLTKEKAIFKGDFSTNNFIDCNSITETHNLFSCKSNKYKLKKIVNGVLNAELPNDYDFGGKEGRGIAGVEMASSIEKLYQFNSKPLITETMYEFDEYARMIRSELVEEGNISRYYYPDENNQAALYNQYAIDNPFKTKNLKIINGKETILSTFVTEYQANDATKGFVMPVNIKTSKGENILDIESTIDLYDENGNPLQTTSKFGIPTSIIYGYDSKLPIMKVKGLSYQNLNNLININALQNYSNNDINEASENTFRNSLLNAINIINSNRNDINEIKAFTYDENVGITSEINTNGTIIYYQYDTKNRLIKVMKGKDMNSSGLDIIKTFSYDTVGVTP